MLVTLFSVKMCHQHLRCYISHLAPTQAVSNVRHQHRFFRIKDRDAYSTIDYVFFWGNMFQCNLHSLLNYEILSLSHIMRNFTKVLNLVTMGRVNYFNDPVILFPTGPIWDPTVSVTNLTSPNYGFYI